MRGRWLRERKLAPYWVLCGLVLLITLSLLLTGWFLYAWLVVDLPPPGTLPARTIAPSSKIYDRQGRLLYEILDPHFGKHTPLPLEEIPLYLRQATIATEDASFYRNPGVDLWGILRALAINLQGGEVLSGGSTITQQVARNLLLSPEERAQRTLVRKLRETILAWRLARTYSKDDILALYLNETYYGSLAYGVEAAAQAYFGKHVGELDLAECVLLAGLPQAPARYNPLENLQAARERQAVVLDLMVRQGYITAEQARLAREERLHFASVPFPIRAPHFVMYVRSLLEQTLGEETLRRGGLAIYTTLDLDMLETAQRIARYRLEQLAECPPGARHCIPGGRNVRSAALVALDPHTGEILAMLGSPDYFDPRNDGAVNATTATRQPGSSIKPITYAAAFDPNRGRPPYTAATMIVDVRTAFVTKEGEPYVPQNYDHIWRGPVLLRQALASSYNLVAVKVLDQVGLANMINLARRLGITTFDDSERFGLALTLGGGEVRLLELTAAYAAFANGGLKVDPLAVTRVEDAQGRVIWRAQPGPGERVLDERVAYLITSILSDDQARMSTFGEGGILNIHRPAAVKTGTTTDWRDNWTVGYTPDLVVGVWAGNPDNEPMQHISGVTGAAPIWHDFMLEVLKGQPERQFKEPPGMTHVEVCADNGLLPGPYCSRRIEEIFIAGTEPKEVDTWHRPVKIDVRDGLLATDTCPSEQVVQKVYTFYPAEAQEWARVQGIPQPPPEYSPLCPPQVADTVGAVSNRDDAGAVSKRALVITSPDQGSTFRLTPAIPQAHQQIEIAARPGDGVALAQITLYVDGQPLASLSRPPYRAFWLLAPGEHVVTATGVDRQGNNLSSKSVCFAVE
jgi:1A family penicillin-binding protein